MPPLFFSLKLIFCVGELFLGGSPINRKQPVKMADFLVSRRKMRYDIEKKIFGLSCLRWEGRPPENRYLHGEKHVKRHAGV